MEADKATQTLKEVYSLNLGVKTIYNSELDEENECIYISGNMYSGILSDIINGKDLLEFNLDKGFYEQNEGKKLGYWQELVNNIDIDHPETYLMRNGLTLLHFLIILGYDKLVGEYLEKIKFLESSYSLDPESHPFKIALKINDPKVLEALAYSVGNDPCLDFNENMFFRALKSSSENFRKMISNTLLFHSKLDIKNLPTTAILSEEKLPLCFLNDDTKLSDTQLKEKIKEFEEDGEPRKL